MKTIDLEEKLNNVILQSTDFRLGKKVFMIPNAWNGLKEITEYSIVALNYSDIGWRVELLIQKKKYGYESYFSASIDMFGKAIFETKEEAENALKGVKNEARI